MSDEVLEEYIRQTIEAHRIPEVTFAWQGFSWWVITNSTEKLY
jgi:hypothetical protein